MYSTGLYIPPTKLLEETPSEGRGREVSDLQRSSSSPQHSSVSSLLLLLSLLLSTSPSPLTTTTLLRNHALHSRCILLARFVLRLRCPPSSPRKASGSLSRSRHSDRYRRGPPLVDGSWAQTFDHPSGSGSEHGSSRTGHHCYPSEYRWYRRGSFGISFRLRRFLRRCRWRPSVSPWWYCYCSGGHGCSCCLKVGLSSAASLLLLNSSSTPPSSLPLPLSASELVASALNYPDSAVASGSASSSVNTAGLVLSSASASAASSSLTGSAHQSLSGGGFLVVALGAAVVSLGLL